MNTSHNLNPPNSEVVHLDHFIPIELAHSFLKVLTTMHPDLSLYSLDYLRDSLEPLTKLVAFWIKKYFDMIS